MSAARVREALGETPASVPSGNRGARGRVAWVAAGTGRTGGAECCAPRPARFQRRPRLTSGEAALRARLRRPRRAGTSIVAGAEADRSHAAGVHVRHQIGFLSWGAGSRSSGFWAGRLRRKGSRDELACPPRGQTNIGGQRMTGPQRRPASLRAFPELGLVMRWPGEPPVSTVLRSGTERNVEASRRSGSSAASEWSGVGAKQKPTSQAPWEPRQGSSFSRCYARPSEPASDGRVKSWTLARRSFGVASCPGARGRVVRSG